MGRLIDADVLVKKILQEAAHQASINHPENARGLKYAAKLMKDQPTAYDVDGVVQNIKILRHPYTTFPKGYGELNAYDFYIDKCIEIVKGGGRDE